MSGNENGIDFTDLVRILHGVSIDVSTDIWVECQSTYQPLCQLKYRLSGFFLSESIGQ